MQKGNTITVPHQNWMISQNLMKDLREDERASEELEFFWSSVLFLKASDSELKSRSVFSSDELDICPSFPLIRSSGPRWNVLFNV